MGLTRKKSKVRLSYGITMCIVWLHHWCFNLHYICNIKVWK